MPHSTRTLAGLGLLALAVSATLTRPSHSAGGAVPVQIVNSSSSPVVSRDTDNPRQPYQLQTTIILNPGSTSGSIEPFTVPAGKRLILESVSAANSKIGDTNSYSLGVFANGGGDTGGAHFDVVPDGAPYASVTQPIKLYADAASPVVITLNRTSSTGTADLSVLLSGYFVEVP